MNVRAQCGEGCVKEFASHDHDNIERPPAGCPRTIGFEMPEDRTQPPLRQISRHSRAYLARGDDAEAIGRPVVRPRDDRHVPRRDASSALLHGLKLVARTQTNA